MVIHSTTPQCSRSLLILLIKLGLVKFPYEAQLAVDYLMDVDFMKGATIYL